MASRTSTIAASRREGAVDRGELVEGGAAPACAHRQTGVARVGEPIVVPLVSHHRAEERFVLEQLFPEAVGERPRRVHIAHRVSSFGVGRHPIHATVGLASEPVEVSTADVGPHVLRKEARVERVRGGEPEVLLVEPKLPLRDVVLVRQVDPEQARIIGVEGDEHTLAQEPERGVFGE
jgi:hypothetical protein